MADAVNKGDLIKRVAMRGGISETDASNVVNHTIGVILDSLGSGEEVSIAGFGRFSLRSRSARTGRNPRTGQTMQIPASMSVGFRPGKKLKDAVQQQ